jgi:hypothetical protein
MRAVQVATTGRSSVSVADTLPVAEVQINPRNARANKLESLQVQRYSLGRELNFRHFGSGLKFRDGEVVEMDTPPWRAGPRMCGRAPMSSRGTTGACPG